MEAYGNKPKTCQKKNKAKSMLDKATNHVIKAKRAK